MNQNTILTDGQTEPLVTVVIPVYNREKLINRTIDSLLAQPCSSFLEVLLVDDGSTDSSGNVCDKYGQTYNNIRVIHKTNGGVASARNVGIENASGKYVAFLDSDDFWNEDFFDSELADELKNSAIDIYDFSYKVTNRSMKYYKLSVVSDNEYVYEKNEMGRYNYSHHCAKFYSMKFLKMNSLQYPESDISEDLLFCERCFFLMRSYKSINKCIFTYWSNNKSTTHRINCEKSFSEKCKGLELNRKWFFERGQNYNTDYVMCMMFCEYLKELCCIYKYRLIKEKLNNDDRLEPIYRYKELGLASHLYKIINMWLNKPKLYYLKCQLKEKPKYIIKQWLFRKDNWIIDLAEYIDFKIIRKYNTINNEN